MTNLELVNKLLEQEHDTIMNFLEIGEDIKTVAGAVYFVDEFINMLSEEDDDGEV